MAASVAPPAEVGDPGPKIATTRLDTRPDASKSDRGRTVRQRAGDPRR
jgi:hypothetical protein